MRKDGNLGVGFGAERNVLTASQELRRRECATTFSAEVSLAG